MLKKILIICLLGTVAFVSAEDELTTIGQSWQGNEFKDGDGWTVSEAKDAVAQCSGVQLFGGFKNFGQKVIVSKLFDIPSHSSLTISLQFWKINEWNQEDAFVFIDDQVAWTYKFKLQDGEKKCGNTYPDMAVNINANVKHTGATALVLITTNVNLAADRKAWAVRDFILKAKLCPDGCDSCSDGDTTENCNFWKSFMASWTDKDSNKLGADGWEVSGGVQTTSNCGSVALFGGHEKFGTKTIIRKVLQLPAHYKLKIKLFWAKIDLWNGNSAQIKIDGKIVWERKLVANEGYANKMCGAQQWTEADVDHTGAQATFEITTTLNNVIAYESFGLRDLYLYYASCSANCLECTGPKEADCKSCQNNWALVDGKCQALPNMILLEQSFFEEKFTGINNWVLDKHKGGVAITECGGRTLVGGFNSFGYQATAKKVFTLPAHKRLRLQTAIYKIDAWPNQDMIVKVDGTQIWKRTWNQQTGGANFCGQSNYFDSKETLDEIFNHQNSLAEILFSSTLNQDAQWASWGFREFKIFYEAKEPCSVFYTECDYKGASFEFCGKSPNFQNDNIPPVIRSIKVPPQGRVTLYESTDYNGKKIVFTKDQPCIEEFEYTMLLQNNVQMEGEWIEVRQ